MKRPVVLVIRDGWGINPGGPEGAQRDGNATLLARTPFHERLYASYPGSTLSASGLDVGLPDGQMGNSEVGHLNLGAGRIIYQDLTRINLAIDSGDLARNPVLQEALAKARGARLHLWGLLSDGGVHSHQEHLVALTRTAREAGVSEICIHAITDGRDTSPTGGADYIDSVARAVEPLGAKILTIVGRYFAMDRDRRWDRTKIGWDAIVLGRGIDRSGTGAADAIRALYAEGKTDEFLPAIILDECGRQRVADGDVVLCFNFRSDRARQISQAFLFPGFDGFDRESCPRVHYVTLTEYDKTYSCPIVFPPQTHERILGQVVSEAGLTQLRIAETEKYPHVTYFFNGGVEIAYPGEERQIIPSPKVATYDLKPEMSAHEVTETVTRALPDFDLVILNFANPDMVGHTGVLEAAIRAVETIDACVERVVSRALELGGRLLVTADHGNCEMMRNPDGSPHTAHTTNLVHFLYVAEDSARFRCENGILADVAPSLLALLGLPQPAEMTGRNLVLPR